MNKKILAVIPARGGSKGIPRKNVRLMAGRPLISYAIDCAKKSSYNLDVVVTSDDDEILSIAQKYGAEGIERPSYLAEDNVTMDPVVSHAVNHMEKIGGEKYDIVITMQPTSPLLSVETLDGAIGEFLAKDYDTILSAINDRHLSWRRDEDGFAPNYKQRLNRQYLPDEYRETGAFVITRREFVTEKSRFGDIVSVYEMPEEEAGDIDTIEDWWIAEMRLRSKTILIRVEGYPAIGLGHIYRGILLAQGLMEHNVFFVISDKSKLGIEKLESSHYRYIVIKDNSEVEKIALDNGADIIINDILDTDEGYIRTLKSTGARIINFEDKGSGSFLADAAINALYERPYDESFSRKSFFWGSKYYLIKEEFLINEPREFSEKMETVLVTFGGTDPSNLTAKAVEALIEAGRSTSFKTMIVLGLGYDREGEIEALIRGHEDRFEIVRNVPSMSLVMRKADLAICSQGRTMLELASMGVPTVIMSQNERETSHDFGDIGNGFLNLGLGRQTSVKTVAQTIAWISGATEIRRSMRQQMLATDLRHGMSRVKDIILGD